MAQDKAMTAFAGKQDSRLKLWWKEKMDAIRIAGWLGFLLYLGVLMYLMFFADQWGRTRGYVAANFIPFREIFRYLSCWQIIGLPLVLLNLLGNVVGFMPFGFFIPLLHRERRYGPLILFCGLVFSVMIELIQLLAQVGSCDIDDVILNTLGAYLGFRLFIALRDYRRRKRAVLEKERQEKEG